jgi:hypothetical protein
MIQTSHKYGKILSKATIKKQGAINNHLWEFTVHRLCTLIKESKHLMIYEHVIA